MTRGILTLFAIGFTVAGFVFPPAWLCALLTGLLLLADNSDQRARTALDHGDEPGCAKWLLISLAVLAATVLLAISGFGAIALPY